MWKDRERDGGGPDQTGGTCGPLLGPFHVFRPTPVIKYLINNVVQAEDKKVPSLVKYFGNQ